MKKWIIKNCLIFVFCIAAVLTAQGTTVRNSINQSEYQIVSLSEATQNQLQDFFSGESPNSILKCSQGDVFPFQVTVKGEFILVEGDPKAQRIKIMKTCFIKNNRGTYLFSTDREKWKEFKEFFTGEVSVTVNTVDDHNEVFLDLLLNQRK